jgi:hypothetical protein
MGEWSVLPGVTKKHIEMGVCNRLNSVTYYLNGTLTFNIVILLECQRTVQFFFKKREYQLKSMNALFLNKVHNIFFKYIYQVFL